MPGIFLSYARETSAAAKTLADDMESLGYVAWLDQDLNGGKAWWDEILAQIRDCEIFVLALSPASLNSPACSRECSYARDLGKPILPIMVADGVGVVPARLSSIHYVEYRNPDRDALARLARTLKAMPPAGALPQALPEPPPIPQSYLEAIAEQIDAAVPLSSKDQSEIVSQLRSGLNEPDTAKGARELLVRFSKREDLLARTSKEIEALLNPADPSGTPLSPAVLEAQIRADPTQSYRLVDAEFERRRFKRRLIAGLLGAVIGTAIGLAAEGLDPNELLPPSYSHAILPAFGGLLAGLISQGKARVVACAVAGAIVGPALAYVSWPDGTSLLDVSRLLMPVGAVIGTTIGAIVGKLRNWS